MKLGITPKVTTNFNQTKNSKQIAFGLDELSPKEFQDMERKINTHNAVVRLLRGLIEISPERKTAILEQFRTFANSLPYGATADDIKNIANKIRT